jgi:hypothetical protein
LIAVALFATLSFAQNGGHLLINNDNINANTADIDAITATGGISRLTTVSTGGVGLGGGYFAAPRNAVAQNFKCFWVTDAATSDIASFEIPSLTKTGNFSNGALSGDLYGIGITQVGNFLVSAWSASANIAVLKINSDCTLTMVGSPLTQPDNVADVTTVGGNKGFIVSYPNAGGAQAYAVSSTGHLTPVGSQLVFNNAVSECADFGCFPTAQDVNNAGLVVWGNATLSGPSTLSANLGPSGFSNPQIQEYSSSVGNVETPWFSPAARSGTAGANLYLGASGFGPDAELAGIIVTTVTGNTITYASTTVNNSAYYAGNVQTIGNSGTGSPVTQIWSDSSANNTVNTYTVSGTTLTPAHSLATSSSGSFAFSTNGVGH